MPTLSQTQVQKLLQKLSPQQIQMIKLLELPAIQLEQRIKQEIEENPVLEEEVKEDAQEDGEEPKQVSVDEFVDDTPSYKLRTNNHSRDDQQKPVYITEGRSLAEYLEEQIGFRELSPKQRQIAGYLIGSIDDDGYVRRDLESIADDMAFSLGIDAQVPELEEVLNIIHELEPAGAGARSLQECLLLQLDRRKDNSKEYRLARKVLKDYFTEFSKKHYAKLISHLGVDESEFRNIIDVITNLSPKPGNLYNEGGSEAAPYIIPDFILDYQDGQFDLSLNARNVPEVKINRDYMDMVREKAAAAGGSDSEKEAMQFLKSKIDSAKWFISAIKQRQETLMRTMTEILNYQREFFEDGDFSKLRPMILKDIADRTGLDVSTISRVVNSKHIQTNFGIVPLKQLFSEAMQTESGEEVSSYEIKEILSNCIQNENKRKPLTDEVLMDILNEKGYKIARRTVAKYREMLGIPVARLRKEI